MANIKNMNSDLSVNQITPGTQVNGGYGTGDSQPPRNRIVPMAHMVTIATYSPSMNSDLSVNQITPGTQVNGGYGTGDSQPPRNRIVPMAHMVTIATYSPSMNIM